MSLNMEHIGVFDSRPADLRETMIPKASGFSERTMLPQCIEGRSVLIRSDTAELRHGLRTHAPTCMEAVSVLVMQRGDSPLTRPFGATSPARGEMMCERRRLHSPFGGRGRRRSVRVRVAARRQRSCASSQRNHHASDTTSSIAEYIAVAVDGRHATQMGVQDFRTSRKEPLPDEIDHSLHGFSLVNRVGHHAFKAC
jgi:hypothetical protein